MKIRSRDLENPLHDLFNKEADIESVAESVLALYQWEMVMSERLSHHPEGFSFSGNGRMCSVCLDDSSHDMWYDNYGMRCADCEAAYRSKSIPAYVVEGHRDKGYIIDTLLSLESGLKGAQIKQLVAQRKLCARIIKREAKADTYLFLRSENPLIEQYFVGS